MVPQPILFGVKGRKSKNLLGSLSCLVGMHLGQNGTMTRMPLDENGCRDQDCLESKKAVNLVV